MDKVVKGNTMEESLLKLDQDWEKKYDDFLKENDNSRNFFRLVEMQRFEIKHSNLLAWLLRANESHELHGIFMKYFMERLVSKYPSLKKTIGDIEKYDFDDVTVKREYKDIDILARSENSNFNLIIENKIDSGEHDEQLSRYEEIVTKEYAESKNVYVYLTLNGALPSIESWKAFSYRDVESIIKKILKTQKLDTKIKFFLEDYLQLTRENTGMVEDEKEKLAREFLKNHKEALDFIKNYSKSATERFVEILKGTCNESSEIEFTEDASNKTYIRFKTDNMNKMTQDDLEGKNKTWSGAKYFYEMLIESTPSLQLSIKKANENKATENLVKVLRANNDISSESKHIVKKFTTDYSTKVFIDDLSTLSPDEMKKASEEFLSSFVAKITEFEKPLKEQLVKND
ncbi:PD-(D/E)XK nuclease family protein [Companilactobacillus bobalius]|nr:PD-(D/E)XK nuclease family protein [Companilactobacillus bobalius]KAE9560146.1 hypothetical protein ATN92_07930 [Companilactobacillus bobalius]OVE99495.1 hypothetical protein LKACC16343_00608 [Companilactobacillus bobalius]GEO57475.1 hypothetical protein LBO01_06040 [Companilactobacillus paralimentarius]